MKTSPRRLNIKSIGIRQQRQKRISRRETTAETAFVARMSETEAVQFLADSARNDALPIKLRISCAKDIIRLSADRGLIGFTMARISI